MREKHTTDFLENFQSDRNHGILYSEDYLAGYTDRSLVTKEYVDAQIPVVEFNLVSIPVNVETRRIRANWTPELQQDLMAYHNIDAELELFKLLTWKQQRNTAKRRRYKDRKRYKKLLEEWIMENE